jgi:hypothetical protein
VELVASCVGGVTGGVVGIYIVGFTWTGFFAALVCGTIGFITAWVCIFLLYLFGSPKALDERWRSELAERSAQHQSEVMQCRSAYEDEIAGLRRSLEEERAMNARPEIVGEIRDFIIFPIFSRGQHDEAEPDIVKDMLQPRPVVTGSDITILVFLHNVRLVPTAIKYLQLTVEEDGERFVVDYADDGEIYQEQAGGERVRRLLNLNMLDSNRILTPGEPVEGALRFLVEGHAPKEAKESFALTLIVTDAFGGEHKISIGGKPPHPSDRLLARLEAKETAKRKSVYDSLGRFIEQGRVIEEYKSSNTALYESSKPRWRGRVYEYLQGGGRTHLERFEQSDLENDIVTLEEIQRDFMD